MSRTTIDFGIDLGTTNSAIAVLKGVTPEIIKNNRDQDITPSAVGYRKNGLPLIGIGAKNFILNNPDDAFAEFKRQMGTDYTYSFKTSGFQKKPEDLSAEVLKELRTGVSSITGEEVLSAVITVPAAFELHQCDATRKAAELAGIEGSPLLQEPVAAALAYGFQVDSEKAYWLVYDFGGGTFDAAVIKAEEGLINVVHHGGNNFLGGSDIDWAILEKLVLPKLVQNFDLPGLQRGNDTWKTALLKLKHAVEQAKIELTTKEIASLVDCKFEDQSGSEVDCEEISLSRNDIISLAEPIIRRSTDICRQVLLEKNLSPSQIEKVIVVGGPTKAPYFRDILKGNLGIPIDFSMDPLTVVAKGAAVFAGTQKLDSKLMQAAKLGEFQFEPLKSNKPIGHEIDPLAGGKITSPDGLSVEGFTVEIVNAKTQWRSGKIALRSDGAFIVNLLAEKGERNVFNIELYDPAGTRQKTVPDHMTYIVGGVIEEQPIIHNIGVALVDNRVDWFFKKGTGLPQKKKSEHQYKTSHAIKTSEQGDAIKIPIVEGENEQAADRNRLIALLDITSSMIRRDLPAGSEVELTMNIDESRLLSLNIYIPTLDEEFDLTLPLRKTTATGDDVAEDFAKEKARLNRLIRKADDANDKDSLAALRDLESSELMKEIVETVSAAKGDADAAEKAEVRLLEFKLRLDDVERGVEWPTLVSETNGWLEDLDKLVKQNGSSKHQDRAAELSQEAAGIISKKETERLSRKLKEIQNFYFQVLFSIPGYWVDQLRRLEKDRSKMENQAEADRLLDMGRNYLNQNNVDGLRNVVTRLWELLPKQEVENVQRGFGPRGLIR
ncbi:MAG: Hsp70 family protein [Terrimicrobiaceae bacterium]|nr:Hsp70 family protein [Terrimicrobiaceae bacterium]